MSITVQEIYDQVCHAMLEPGGLRLGLFTQAQFLDVLGVVLFDFAQSAGLVKNIFTTPVLAGVATYVVPDDVMKPEVCFVAGRIIEKATESEIATSHRSWRKKIDTPRQWHEDNLAPKLIEIFPRPLRNGNSYPATTVPPGKYGDFFPEDSNLTMVGPAAPSQTAWLITDTLDAIPDIFGHYLVYGVLEQVFSSESEMRDMQRALYCRTRWQECLALADAIGAQDLEEGDE